MNEYLATIEKRVINLLKTIAGGLTVAAKDRCSEVARLVGCWILRDYPEAEVIILKGELKPDLAHDVAAIKILNRVYIVDPTVWQIFPESSSIIVGEAGSLERAIHLLRDTYGGTWNMSESLKEYSIEQEHQLRDVIAK